jgi:L-Ala-D/L-Glu epimerase
MARIKAFEVFAVDIPFRRPFEHAANRRSTSSSILVKCLTDSNEAGFGECLPREYVTGETRDHAFAVLAHELLPNLVGKSFVDLHEVIAFLHQCDGKAPDGWISPDIPHISSWSAVDLALLDAVGHATHQPVRLSGHGRLNRSLRYSAVISADRKMKNLINLILIRLYGFQQVKLKLRADTTEKAIRRARRVLGGSRDIRVDANMAWDRRQAVAAMRMIRRYGITSFEQPLAADDIAGLAELIRETGLAVMADESASDRRSFHELIARRACTAVNVRISKCGGLVAAYQRCRQVLEANMTLQVGCMVGETSLLSAAQLILLAAVGCVTYAEGCFGRHLLHEDPAVPLLQFGYAGRPPELPDAPGLGVRMDESLIRKWCVSQRRVS